MTTTTTTQHAQEQERQALSRGAIDRIGRRWPANANLPALMQRYPALNSAIESTTANLDKIWISCRLGMATMPEFRAALLDFERAHYKAIEQIAKGGRP